jgi:excisionase family DNA binding protein
MTSISDLSPREVATELGCDVQTIYNMIDRGDLPAIRYGTRFLRITRAALDTFKATHHTKLDADTIAFLSELAAAAPALTEKQKDTIRAAFRGQP